MLYFLYIHYIFDLGFCNQEYYIFLHLGFYVTAVDETLKKETDNDTIGLLLCEDKDKLTVEWSLKNVNAPIGVASYKVKNIIPKEIMEKLPKEEELNLYIKKLPNEEIEEEND